LFRVRRGRPVSFNSAAAQSERLPIAGGRDVTWRLYRLAVWPFCPALLQTRRLEARRVRPPAPAKFVFTALPPVYCNDVDRASPFPQKSQSASRGRGLFFGRICLHLAAAETGSNVKSVWCLANVRCTSTTEPWTCGRQQAKEGSVNKPRTTRRPEQYTLHSQVATCGSITALRTQITKITKSSPSEGRTYTTRPEIHASQRSRPRALVFLTFQAKVRLLRPCTVPVPPTGRPSAAGRGSSAIPRHAKASTSLSRVGPENAYAARLPPSCRSPR
jgi:hypothetical protein